MAIIYYQMVQNLSKRTEEPMCSFSYSKINALALCFHIEKSRGPMYGLIGQGSSTVKPWWEKEKKQPNGKKIQVEDLNKSS